MSAYQYYEFLAVDRPLDERALEELRALSTRATLTPTSLINTYHWGDFRGDPRRLMAKYFDAFLYLAGWGTRQLMIRLPAALLDIETARRYCAGEAAGAWTANGHVILQLVSEDENGDWETGGEGWLTSIIPARAELAAGDLRMLYLAWLLCAQDNEPDDEFDDDSDDDGADDNSEGDIAGDVVEPPVPPGLGTLTGPLRSLADFLRIDDDLLAVAAEASEPAAPDDGTSHEDLVRWIENLPVAEKNALLVRVASGADTHLRVELLRRFRRQHTDHGAAVAGRRTVRELLAAAQARRTHREQLAAQQRAQEQARRERAAAIAREERLTALATEEEPAWQRVSTSIDTKKPAEYDVAVALLVDLRTVAERQRQREAFDRRFEQLRRQHLRKPSLLQRFDRAGLG